MIDDHFAWIDRQAAEWAEMLCAAAGHADTPLRPVSDGWLWPVSDRATRPTAGLPAAGKEPSGGVGKPAPNLLAYLNVLDLRYYLVKLLRVVGFFTELRPLEEDDSLELVLQPGRDDDYADVIAELARTAAAAYRQQEAAAAAGPPLLFPPNGLPRRWLGRLANCLALGGRRRTACVSCCAAIRGCWTRCARS